ncbi:DNA-binding protein SMUBP-2-like isoform X2 [Watersipora subatra]|uniref:DNA-binding protein SMUBP-2-like isoform X2 n=1 Tax=Watersipora subatra TaxID=2589382 RepID=UPI00355BAE19
MSLFLQDCVDKYCHQTEELLKLERDAELEQARDLHESVPPKLLEKRGVCLTKLIIDSRKTSLYGRQILTLRSSNVNRPELPANSITNGDIVGLHELGPTDLSISSGIVIGITSSFVSIAFEPSDELAVLGDDSHYYVVKLSNDVTYKRLKHALTKLRTGRNLPSSRLISVLFNQYEDSTHSDSETEEITSFHNESLDTSQQDAVKLALRQEHLAIIHGPPGTGKSTTVIEVIRQLVSRGLKVLACAPSNVAVDNLVLRLAKAKVDVTRLGHPARAMHEIQKYSLDARVAASEEHCLVEDIRSEIETTLKSMRQGKGRPAYQSLRTELKALRKELKEKSHAAVAQVLKHSHVILSTLTSATEEGPLKALQELHFDVVVIDECSQALEAACWIGLLQANKCVLAGDHLQLPPTILSHKAAEAGLGVTLMERLIATKPGHVHMLTTQYRMNKQIMQWASHELYNDQLTADSLVANHLLRGLQGVEENEITSEPLILIDTEGCNLPELDLPDEQSHGNEGEADLVAIHVSSLIDSGVRPCDIAVISPYNLQVELIRNRLSQKYRELEIKSVDGYQGREKEAVVISLVRSNNKGQVGFLSEDRRLNVAVTRARRQVTVVCDSNTVKTHPFLCRLIEYMSTNGVVYSAAEYDCESLGQTSAKVAQLMSTQLSIKNPNTLGSRDQSKKSARRSRTEPNKSVNKDTVRQDPYSISTDRCSGVEATVSIKESKAEREARIKQEMDTELSHFLASEDTVHTFPPSLNSYQRMVVHELAASYGLEHESVGEGAKRHLVVRKQTKTKSEMKLEKNPVITDKVVSSQNSDVSPNPDTQKCKVCGKMVPQSNIHLHSLRCTSLPEEKSGLSDTSCRKKSTNPQVSSTSSNQPSNKADGFKERKIKEKKKTVDAEVMLNKVDSEDFDALLAAADKLNSVCNMKKCKTLVKTLGVNCPHCTLRFCLNHSMPEVHGCGAAAKTEARNNIRKEGKLYNGSGIPSKKPNEAKRANLERKLQKKMSKLTEQRKPKEK